MLYKELTEQDIELINTWINLYASGESASVSRRASLDKILRVWNQEKVELFKLMGKKFILSKEVSFAIPETQLRSDLRTKMRDDPECRQFIRELREIFEQSHKFSYEIDDKRKEVSWFIHELTGPSILVANSVSSYGVRSIPLADGKPLAIQDGAKPVKIIGKIAQSYGVEGFEKFRIAHSQVLNQSKLKGELCLSIHPLDFMTMSDNDCGWNSCMSWRDNGGYRLGTVEMLNSPVVVCAYLNSSEPFRWYDKQWNSKKWRSLFVVTPEAITSVKGYPYQSKDLASETIKWLGELANANLSWNIDTSSIHSLEWGGEILRGWTIPKINTKVKLNFETGSMYNDFGSCTHYCAITNDRENIDSTIYYSGEANCMWCGEYGEMEDEGMVVCNNCERVYYCDCCDERIYGDHYEIDDEILCYNCYENYTTTDPISGETHRDSYMTTIYLSHSNSEYKPYKDDCPTLTVDVYEGVWENDPINWNRYFKIPRPKEHQAWWEVKYWVSPNDCTEVGLDLFSLNNSEEAIAKYLEQAPSQPLD